MAGLDWTLVALLVTWAVLQDARVSGARRVQYQRNARMNGLQLTAAALFQVSAYSAVPCGMQCSRVERCLSFTFTGNEPSSCRGYGIATTSPNANNTVPAAGAETFEADIADWLGTPCSANKKCTVVDAECFKGQCLCTPGFYYSTGYKTCLQDCPLADLRDGFVKYRNSVRSSTSRWADIVTSASCQDTCAHTITDCRFLNFRLTSPLCIVKDAGSFVRNNGQYDTYQRTCA